MKKSIGFKSGDFRRTTVERYLACVMELCLAGSKNTPFRTMFGQLVVNASREPPLIFTHPSMNIHGRRETPFIGNGASKC
jgi:hypothetical protein